MKDPLDRTAYEQDPRSAQIRPDMPNGSYVYVQDENGAVFVLPDGPHLHPKVLGGARPAMYAGDLTIEDGTIVDVTNLSGTFQFDDPDGLLAVADKLIECGCGVKQSAVRFFPSDGSRPVALR